MDVLKKQPWWVKEYYVNKFPLYMKEGINDNLNNLFIPVENFYTELLELNVSYKKILSSPVLLKQVSKSVESSMEYGKLKYYYNLNKTDMSKPFEWYLQLVNLLKKSNLHYIQNWEEISRLFDLVGKIKFILVDNVLQLQINSTLDPIIKQIFKEVCPPYVLSVFEQSFDEDIYESLVYKKPYFDRLEKDYSISFDNSYFNKEIDNE